VLLLLESPLFVLALLLARVNVRLQHLKAVL
jgi:hypothetical protein